MHEDTVTPTFLVRWVFVQPTLNYQLINSSSKKEIHS